jgi:hypothetical protein
MHPHNFVDLTGQVHGKFTVIELCEQVRKKHESYWHLRCNVCGLDVPAQTASNIKRGNVRCPHCPRPKNKPRKPKTISARLSDAARKNRGIVLKACDVCELLELIRDRAVTG